MRFIACFTIENRKCYYPVSETYNNSSEQSLVRLAFPKHKNPNKAIELILEINRSGKTDLIIQMGEEHNYESEVVPIFECRFFRI